jgi:hypothetical protein
MYSLTLGKSTDNIGISLIRYSENLCDIKIFFASVTEVTDLFI